jgi:thiol-disulfide isomerase/thioredoxin
VGGAASNFILSDEKGNLVALSDYCDKAVYIEVSAMWCGPCKGLAEELEGVYQKYKARGLAVLSILVEDEDFKPVTPPNLGAWARAYGLTSPVLGDPTESVYGKFGMFGFPQVVLLAPGGIVSVVTGGEGLTDSQIEQVLP